MGNYFDKIAIMLASTEVNDTYSFYESLCCIARLAQSVEHETLNLRVVGSSPTLGENRFLKLRIDKFQHFQHFHLT